MKTRSRWTYHNVNAYAIERQWIRYGGKIIRVLCAIDYGPCVDHGEQVQYLKRISHRRWPRGREVAWGNYDLKMAHWYSELPLDQWCEIVLVVPVSHQLTA